MVCTILCAKVNKSLTHLDISNTKMTNEGGKAFVKALEGSPKMLRLISKGDIFSPEIEERIGYWLNLNTCMVPSCTKES